MPLASQTVRASLVAILIAVAALLFVVTGSTAAPVVTTDKADYYSGETVTITGAGFAASTSYDVPVIRPDGSIVLGDGSFTPGWDSVSSDGSGEFTYLYELNGLFGSYEVRVYNSPWSGDLADSPLATATFTDADIHFTQCKNDSNNDGLADACGWTTGGLNQNNSLYTEGDAPPQRLFHRLAEVGTHTFGFEYEFSKSDVYAYDFITNVDSTQSGALLAECADLPGFISAAQCTTMFSTNVQLGAVPTDPFDQVDDRENPPGAAARSFRVGCTPACAVGVTIEFPDPPTGPTDGEDNPGGEAHVPDTDPDCFKACGDSSVKITVSVTTTAASTRVGIWFAGHLAETADPIGSAIGWGTGCNGGGGCGSSSISGAPFHVKYTCLREPSDSSCESVGNRDNQIQTGGVLAPGIVTIVKDAVPDDAQDFSFSGDLGAFTLDDDGANGNPLDSSMTFTSLTPGSYAVTEAVPAGWDLTSLSCIDPDGGTVIAPPTATIDVDSGEDITCTFTNTRNDATFKVTKTFDDGNLSEVTITLSCTSGVISPPNPATTVSQMVTFTIEGFTDPGATCTASESGVPAGYTTDNSNCLSVGISPSAQSSCTITNTRNDATFKVTKTFDDGNLSEVTITLSCTSGVISPPNPATTSGQMVTFTIEGFTDPGTTCTANESGVPASYTTDNSNCLNVGISPSAQSSCTIENTLIPPTLTVNKACVPSSDTGLFNLRIDSVTHAADAPCGGSTGAVNVSVGAHTVSETAGTGTNLASYTTAFSGDCDSGGNVTLAAGESKTCTITNTLNVATFKVTKTFDDGNLAEVTVSLSCTSGTISPPNPATTSGQMVTFTIEGFTDPGTTCTANESGVPAGYTTDNSDCLSVGISPSAQSSCTIVNTLNVGTFKVTKTFSDGNLAEVTVSLSCNSGTISPPNPATTIGQMVTFTIEGFTDPGTTCTASESGVPAGYTTDNSNCLNVGISPSAQSSCTIENTLNVATFKVTKTFSDSNLAEVTVTLSCTSGTVSSPNPATTTGQMVTFTIEGFTDPGATCTASESGVPAGYTTDNSNCLSVGISPSAQSSCTIVNTLNVGTFKVTKTFSDGNLAEVTVSLSCTSGTISPPNPATTTGQMVTFTIEGFTDPGTTCTASESGVPAGYTTDNSNCLNVGISPSAQSSCTITNTRNDATFKVTKTFDDGNLAEVTITLSCTSGTISPPNPATTTGQMVTFTIEGFTDPGTTCTATESGVPAGYITDNSNCLSVAISPSAQSSCAITNTLIPPETGTIRVCKETTPGASPQIFTFTPSYSPDFDLTDGQCNDSDPLTPGSYSVSETVPTSWTLSSATCDDGSPVSAIDLGPSETVTCTFNNTETGATPPPPPPNPVGGVVGLLDARDGGPTLDGANGKSDAWTTLLIAIGVVMLATATAWAVGKARTRR